MAGSCGGGNKLDLLNSSSDADAGSRKETRYFITAVHY